MDESAVVVVKGPTVGTPATSIIYNITLPSGMVVTRPGHFGSATEETREVGVVVTQDGRVLMRREPF